MSGMTIAELEKLLPPNDELKQLTKITQPVKQLEFLVKLYPSQSLVKLVDALRVFDDLSVRDMAIILHELEYPLNEAAGALRGAYTDLSNRVIIAALADPEAYQSEGRTNMIAAAQWTGTILDPGMGLSSFEALDAVLPAYPEFNVLNYEDNSHATLSTKVAASPDEACFFYKNDHIDKNWSLSGKKCGSIYKSDDISVTATSDTAGRGLFRVGTNERWYYDLSLFANTNDLHQQILGFVANGCGVSACTIEVNALEKWQKTGFMVGKDQNVVIKYISGQWTANPQYSGLYGPDGLNITAKPGYALPGVNEGSLVGRIKDHAFYIGAELNLPSGLEGELELTINDDLDGRYGAGYPDNQGSLTVLISRDSSL
jgi:hypothetical protein